MGPSGAEKIETLYRSSIDSLRIYRENRSDNRSSLEESIDLAREAAELLKDTTAADTKSKIWNHLGIVLQHRYVDAKSGLIRDIDESIQYKESGLKAMSLKTKATVRARRMMGLGKVYGWRCQADRKGHGEYDYYFRQAQDQFHDALKALNSVGEALQATKKIRVEILDSQGISYRDHYHATLNLKGHGGAKISSLHASISCFEEALEHASQIQSYSTTRYKKILAVGYGDLIQSLDEVDFHGSEPAWSRFWSNGLALSQGVVDDTPDDHHNRAETLYNLASFYQDRYLHSRKLIKNMKLHENASAIAEDSKLVAKELNKASLRKAMEFHEKALNHTKSPIYNRMEAGQQAMFASIELEIWSEAVTIAEQLLDLAEQLALPTHSDEDHERILRTFPRLGATAASVFIKAGKPAVEALQILERGTGLIDYLALQKKTKRDLQEMGRKPSEAHLLCLASDGPVVCFNVTWLGFYCSHAFIMTSTEVRAIELGQGFTDLKVEECVKAIASDQGYPRSYRAKPLSYTENGVTKAAQSTTESGMKSYMIWLWNEAVKPILEELEFFWRHEPPPELPLIWWVGGGLTALLPMHAAGYHNASSNENTISHVISSYAPSLKRLQASRSRVWVPLQSSESTRKASLGIIAMPTTPGSGFGVLNTKKEIESIQRHIAGTAHVDTLITPSKEQTLRMFESSQMVHLACHAELDPESSFRSNLILGSGSKQERLSVGDIRSINLHSAQIAYLSACSTAASLDADLVYESIHLASAFQLEFRHFR
ncbi:hypothetical protein LEMA_P093170.1 [Plenodomus lingam JN3]|uniref:CHAT domain-containing protein n=1 Tax=Leptosphaeria maculans (strain JN3 / isolate v23.1.3 / race Av1-4-5-6-7-8) TaxID=985895 RepID=E5A2W2_LEPMJ|nr:hypothetical protein LEMA_P093170.1 [Plenodomus lingam JN3]CBX97908.1 hypothetical protein LEMA_P093170.1 [Plenodomus lingam JN3]